MSKTNITNLLIGILVVVAVAGAGYWLLRWIEPDACRICRREIQPQARAIAQIDGKNEPVCCARCAFTMAHQEHKPVRLVEVTDYVSQRRLDPRAAYYVEGSRVLLCARHEPLLDASKEPFQRVFDRCEPSIYAFARREEAAAFAAREGGAVLRFDDVVKELEPRP